MPRTLLLARTATTKAAFESISSAGCLRLSRCLVLYYGGFEKEREEDGIEGMEVRRLESVGELGDREE